MSRRIINTGALVLFCLILLGCGTARAMVDKPEGMFDLYENNRELGVPNYITEDFIILAYCMVYSEFVTEFEERVLLPEFQLLVEKIMAKIKAGVDQDDAARANIDFLAVLYALLNGEDKPSKAFNMEIAADELNRIREAAGLSVSELMLQKIDYSQFRIRGKYTRSDALGRYFQAVKYAGTVLFPVKESRSTGITALQADRLTRQALVLARLINEDENLLETYNKFEDDLNWIFGPAEDLTINDYITTFKELKDAPIKDFRAALLKLAGQEKRQPRIISAVVNRSFLEKGLAPKDVLTGWRFIPQRFSPDSAAFQKLVYDSVKNYKGKEIPFTLAVIEGQPVKGFPMALELMALLGSKRAANRLDANDERNYQGYERAFARAEEMLNLPAGASSDHLALLSDWLTRGNDDHPDEDRRLNTCLAFWTYLRYINTLYDKQSYTLAGKGLAISPERTRAWIEPAPNLYRALENQTIKMNKRFKSDRLFRLAGILNQCTIISEKEKNGEPLKEDEVAFLNRLDKELLPLVITRDKPIVVDVHTEPTGGQVLEEAIGLPCMVYKELEGEKARGALFSRFEFKHPMNDRLTDEKWRLIVRDDQRLRELDFSPGSMGK